jgi:murein tripeptide amidase MpaA
VTLRFLNAGQCAYPMGWEGYRVVASYDRQNWLRVDNRFDGQVMSLEIKPEPQCIYFAYFEPYSHEQHLDLIGWAALSERVTQERLGSTLDGRDMTLLHITDAQSATPLAQKKKVWLIARQHPGEAMAEWFVEGFLVRQKMIEVGVDLSLDAHGDEGLPYNFVAGTEGNPGYTPRLEALENAFKAAWLATCPDFQTTHGYGCTPPGQANLTLATNWVGQNFDCLAFTIEMPLKDNADLPDELVGWNGERSKKLGASVLLPLLAVLAQLR